MPFGKYKDFEECIMENKDKKSPEGYCAIMHKKLKGFWPSTSSNRTSE